MDDDRERWDRKYTGELGDEPGSPDAFVEEVVAELAPGRALDLAGGVGRHALWLAARGFEATTWDVSPVGLAKLARHADAAGLAIESRAVDLLEPGALRVDAPFDLVVCVNFLLRPLAGELRHLVPPRGLLVHASFTVDWPGERPSGRFRLELGELAGGFPGFEVELARESDGRAGLVARRSADGG